ETFWFLLGRLPKGTRRKGETASRRYRSNGYAPPKTRTKPISQDETSLPPLAPPPLPTNIKQKENISTPPLKLKDSTTDTVLIGKLVKTTANRPSCGQNPPRMIVPLTAITGLPILMAT
ncbi:hypothetical protein ACCD00_24410, partial [Pseudomonas sp. Pseusp3]|uniref:hypothetical protein n=1 Tax=Pseudomonas sp. Pseusp3 TaxID=3243029 RepID=UPI0039AEB0A7